MYSRQDLLKDMNNLGINPLFEKYPVNKDIFYNFISSNENHIVFINCKKEDIEPIDIYYWNKYHRIIKIRDGGKSYIHDVNSIDKNHNICIPENVKVCHDYSPPGITVFDVVNCTSEDVIFLRKSLLTMSYGAYIILLRGEKNNINKVEKFSELEELML